MGGGKGGQRYISGYYYNLTVHFVLAISSGVQAGNDSDTRSSALNVRGMMVGEKFVDFYYYNYYYGNYRQISLHAPYWPFDWGPWGRWWNGDDAPGLYNKNFWVGSLDLFGGEEGEGGIQGYGKMLPGTAPFHPTPQGQYAALASYMDADAPAFRGVTSIILDDFTIASVNPYVKPWKFLLRDLSHLKADGSNDGANPITKTIDEVAGGVVGMNPADMIYSVLTSNGGRAQFGLGYPVEDIDAGTTTANHSFSRASVDLHQEGLGLNAIWDSSVSAEDFIQDILRYIDGVLFISPSTGKWKLKLFRPPGNIKSYFGDTVSSTYYNGYTPASLTVYDESNIIKVTKYVRESFAEMTNQVSLSWTQVNYNQDGEAETKRVFTIQNSAAIEAMGKVVTTEVDCPYITREEVAMGVAERFLRQYSYPLASIEFEGDRSLYELEPGTFIKFSWEAYGITDMVCRVVKVNYGSLHKNKITVSLVEEVSGREFSMFDTPGPGGWEDPRSDPTNADPRKLWELPRFIIDNHFPDVDMADYDDDAGAVAALMGRPSGDAYGYHLYEKPPGDTVYRDRGLKTFTPCAVLTSAITHTTTTIAFSGGVDLGSRITDGEGDMFALIGDELITLPAGKFTISGSTAQVTNALRGVLDTRPRAHEAGTEVWLFGQLEFGLAPTVCVDGQTNNIRALTKTTRGTLPEADATVNSLVLDARALRPYPVHYGRVNSLYYPSVTWGDLVITWDNRNRLTETAYALGPTSGNAAPEAGTTVDIFVYKANGNLIHSEIGLAATARTWTYTMAAERSDMGDDTVNPAVHVELATKRDGYYNWQRFELKVATRTGFGLFWGEYYGGRT